VGGERRRGERSEPHHDNGEDGRNINFPGAGHVSRAVSTPAVERAALVTFGPPLSTRKQTDRQANQALLVGAFRKNNIYKKLYKSSVEM
jgi:hypothetical protein